jgi:hypothetical protein
VLSFGGQRGRRRPLDFPYREAGPDVLSPLAGWAPTDQDSIPCHDTLDDDLARVGAAPRAGVRTRMRDRLIRLRVWDRARVQGRRVGATAGRGYLVSSEFIDNRDQAGGPPPAGDEKRKHDGERKAAWRLLAGVRKEFPQLRLGLSLDARYAGGVGLPWGHDFPVALVSVFKEGSIPTWGPELQRVLPLDRDNRLEVAEGGWRHRYRWVDEWPDTDSDRREGQLKAIPEPGEGPKGESSEWAWLVSRERVVNAATVADLVGGAGRPRWREENQGFNVPKHSGLNREHASREKDHCGA